LGKKFFWFSKWVVGKINLKTFVVFRHFRTVYRIVINCYYCCDCYRLLSFFSACITRLRLFDRSHRSVSVTATWQHRCILFTSQSHRRERENLHHPAFAFGRSNVFDVYWKIDFTMSSCGLWFRVFTHCTLNSKFRTGPRKTKISFIQIRQLELFWSQ